MDDNELALVDAPKRTKRGPSQLKTKPKEPFNVEFDEKGFAIGKHQSDWSTYVGGMARLRISILEDNWGKIKQDQKDALWEIIKEYFDLTDNDRKISTLKQCNYAWKSFKTYLKENFMIPNKKPYEDKRYTFLEVKDWEAFCRKHRSPENMKKRAIGQVYAKQQTDYARLGRSGYRGMKVDLSKVEGVDEALKAEIMNIACDRTRDWILARITTPIISSDLEALFRKLVDVDKKMTQGLISKEKGADPLIVVLGPEHGGRTRTVGNGIGFREGLNGYKQTRRKNQSTEEIEAIIDRKLAQRDEERDAKRDAQRDAERDAARDAARDAEKEAELEVESDLEREASNEERVQKKRKQSSCESTTVVHREQLKDIKEPKSCLLFSPYTEDEIPIARGMVYPIGDGTIHGGPLLPFYMKVSVDSFGQSFGGTKLPVPLKVDDTITLLEQSVESFFQWPRCRISKILENTPTSKHQASKRKESTLEPTMATLNPVPQETTPLLPAIPIPSLLETHQIEESSTAEDARKAKKDLETKLDNLAHVMFRKQQSVQDAYTRWTSRDDDTADHVFKVAGGMIVGHEDTFDVRVSTEDMMKLWNLDGLDSSILLCFEWGLCKRLLSRNDNRCGFLNPYSIEGSLCLQPGSAVKDYLAHALSISKYDFMLAPYTQEDHWVLFVIFPKQRTGYILDSKNKKQTKKDRSYWLTSQLQDAVGSYKWTMAKCHQQQAESRSGYYVMRWMYDFVNTHQIHFPKTIPWTSRLPLDEKDIDRTVAQWLAMCPI